MTATELLYLAWLAALTWLVARMALALHGLDWTGAVVAVELWAAGNLIAVRGVLARTDRRLRTAHHWLSRDTLRRANGQRLGAERKARAKA